MVSLRTLAMAHFQEIVFHSYWRTSLVIFSLAFSRCHMELGQLFENRFISTEKVCDIDVCMSCHKSVLFRFAVVIVQECFGK